MHWSSERTYGKEVSRMLEANRIHLHSNLEEIKSMLFYLAYILRLLLIDDIKV